MSEQKKGMSTLAKFGIGCGGFIVLIIIIAVISFSGSSTTTPSSNGNQNQNKQTEAKKEFALGETINLKDHQLVVSNLDANYQTGNPYEKPQSPDNSFVIVDIAVTNTGNRDLLVNDWGFKLEDETGTQRNTSWFSGVDGLLQSVTLSPNGKTSGKLAFEAKTGSSKLILHYSGNISSGGEITIKLK
ncbi:MAG: DUF4352 domain-containing protein [Patescibacteria group bacterium]|nr:DUF4352 domain-containing protein [Patescibacteria group bacterium]